jgi:ABC-type uncharacterized transport system permease subunit
VLGDIPLLGPALFRHHPVVYLAMVLVAGLIWFLYRTRAGWCCARWVNRPSRPTHWATPCGASAGCGGAGGALCGVAGAYHLDGLHPAVGGRHGGRQGLDRAGADHLCHLATGTGVAGAYLFGGVTMLQFHLQGMGVQVPSQFLTMLPYVATIVVLVLISRNPLWIRVRTCPPRFGKPFYPGSVRGRHDLR